ncbi:MAG: hypothetical protein ACYTF1_26245, partial [Planctomycetota bacterium]
IRPGRQNVVSVAVLTTAADEYGLPLPFDATLIDSLSVRFGHESLVWPNIGGAPETHERGHLEDSLELDESTADGDLDMVLHFRVKQTGIQPGLPEACVKGLWDAGGGEMHVFFGCDSVRTVPK